jgi:hypothetical protein
VILGAKVRLLKLGDWVRQRLPADEIAELETMVGDVFEVWLIDEYDVAWIEKQWFRPNGSLSHSHTLALDPDEMELA